MPSQTTRPELVTTGDELGALCEKLAKAGRFAFDTEFVAEESYRPVVCLIQAATVDFAALIDPMEGLDATPFWTLVADESVEKIVHAGAEDLALCRERTGRAPANLCDLQIAAGLVGQVYPISLSRLVRLLLGSTLHKTQTLTDWRKRPLTGEQIAYAAEDVVFLPALYDKLLGKLKSLRRIEWLGEECARLCHPETLPRGVPKLRRLKGAGALDGRDLAVADALLAVRDQLAEQYDRPPRAVLKDHLLVELARRGWTDTKRMRTLRGLSLNEAALRKLAEAIERARRLPREAWPVVADEEDTPAEDVLAHLATAVLRDFAAKNHVAAGLLSSKQDVRTLVRTLTRPNAAVEPCALMQGWRADAIGRKVLAVLRGQARVCVRKGRQGPMLHLESE